jgi:hypothetical protein
MPRLFNFISVGAYSCGQAITIPSYGYHYANLGVGKRKQRRGSRLRALTWWPYCRADTHRAELLIGVATKAPNGASLQFPQAQTLIAGIAKLLNERKFAAQVCNHPNCLVLAFSLELNCAVARSTSAKKRQILPFIPLRSLG